MTSWKDNLSFILIEPKEPGNIGASARAMKNMGFKSLQLVNPTDHLTEEARQMACNAGDILRKAEIYSTFKDAIKDKKIVIGTTRRIGRQRGFVVPLKESLKRIITAAKKNRVAIVFGRERNGLTNHEIQQCGLLVTIPSNPAFPSLNLAQSVLLVAYELSQKTYKSEMPELVKNEEINRLCKQIKATLELLEYTQRGHRNLEKKIMQNIKHLIGRAGLTEWELKMMYGMCAQVEKRLRGK